MTEGDESRSRTAEILATEAAAETLTVGLGAPTDDASVTEPLKPGTEIDRYILGEPIGTGGMGIVYEARDPRLGRTVALKLLILGDRESRLHRAQERMLREAKALAQLSHPNVVAVHDVGTYADPRSRRAGQGVFIAMEHVQGESLHVWQKADDRSLDELLKVYVAAGEGLHAAHKAGLVHRDFKPHNVIVGDDGRARVIDFGLARTIEQPTSLTSGTSHGDAVSVDESSTDEETRGGGPLTSTGVEVTRAGTILGTPRYMSPEQHLGEPANASSDQYSFCVALYEAACGTPPFRGQTHRQVFRAMRSGQLSDPQRRVPAWLLRTLKRGLALPPEQRFRDMDALLAVIRRHQEHRFRRTTYALAFAAVASAAFFTLTRTGPLEKCQARADHVTSVVAQAQKRLLGRLDNMPGTHELGSVVHSALETFESSWRREVRAACAASMDRGQHGTTLLDARLLCLDRQLDRVATYAEIAESAESLNPTRVPNALANLTAPTECRDLDALNRVPALPQDPASRRAAEAIISEADRTRSQHSLGLYNETVELGRQVHQRAANAGLPHVAAEALYYVAKSEASLGKHDDAEAALRESARLAASAKLLEQSLKAQIETMWFHAVAKHDPDTAIAQVDALRAQLLFLEEPPSLKALFLSHLGGVYQQASRFVEAKDAFAEAIQIGTELEGPDSLTVAGYENNLAVVLDVLGQYAEAAEGYKKAHRIWSKSLGPNHPRVGWVLHNLGIVALNMEDGEGALRYQEQGLEVLRAALGDEASDLSAVYSALGATYLALEQYDEAVDAAKTCERIMEASLGPEHPDTAKSLILLGTIEASRDNYQAARAYLEAANGRLAAPSANAFIKAQAAHGLGTLLLSHDDLDGCAPMATAHSLITETIGTGHSAYVDAELGLVQCDLMNGRRSAGIARLNTLDGKVTAAQLNEGQRLKALLLKAQGVNERAEIAEALREARAVAETLEADERPLAEARIKAAAAKSGIRL